MSEELKSCPFCGKSDIHIEQKGTFFWCECYDCGAIGRGYYTQPGVNVLQSEDIARGYWNQRPLEDALHTRIAELETEKECEMRVIKDGNAWCFVLPDFQDLQVSASFWMKEGVLDKIYKELRSVKNERQSASND